VEEKAEEGPKHASLFGVVPDHLHKGDMPRKELVDLGRMLYYENRISKNHDLSCNSCHMLDKYGVDNEATSPGHKGVRGDRNSPTSYLAAAHVAQFWDGREPDVEAQAKGPVLNSVEMAMSGADQVEQVLRSIPGYQKAFKAAFPDDEKPISYDNFAIAVGAFERGLVTKNSPFDKYLGGELDAMSDEAKKGLDLFVSTGCTTCHSGPMLGGHMYQKLGLVHPYETEDEGRKKVTGNDADAMMFKVPSLRNVAMTGPYFHDGSVATLPQAVKLMAYHQLGKELKPAEINSIVAFLESLTGELPTDYIAKPELPPSGPKTPKPDPS
jgi:cytochrome c peroxidase